jgi:hypothetical protein
VCGLHLSSQVLRGRDREDLGSRPAWERVSWTTISATIKKLGMVVYVCHPSYIGGISRKITVQICLGQKKEKKVRCYLKNK